MTKTEIDAFLTVVQCGSISAAAEQLFITQPALSRRIHGLEEELGCPLFERGRGKAGVTPTRHGEAFLPIAQRLRAAYAEAAAVKTLDQKPLLRLAAVAGVSACVLPPIFRTLTGAESPCRLSFNLCHSIEAFPLVSGGRCDLALIDYIRMAEQPHSGSVISFPVYSVPFALLGRFGDEKSVSPSRLDPAREVRLPWNMNFDLWHERWFGSGIRPLAATNNINVLRDLREIFTESAYAIVPRIVGEFVAAGQPGLSLYELDDSPPDEVIYCMTKSDYRDSGRVMYFLDLLRARLEAMPSVTCLM